MSKPTTREYLCTSTYHIPLIVDSRTKRGAKKAYESRCQGAVDVRVELLSSVDRVVGDL